MIYFREAEMIFDERSITKQRTNEETMACGREEVKEVEEWQRWESESI